MSWCPRTPRWPGRADGPAVATPPQRAFSAAFGPLISAFNAAANAVVRRLGAEPQDELASARSLRSSACCVRLSAEAGTLRPAAPRCCSRALRFGDKTAIEAMTPRVDCVSVPAIASVAELLEPARASGHLRCPVYGEDLDDWWRGRRRDAFAVPDGGGPDACRGGLPVLRSWCPETLDLNVVLERLREAGAEMAVVVDEYGGFAGVVTAGGPGRGTGRRDPPTSTTAREQRPAGPARSAPGASVRCRPCCAPTRWRNAPGFGMPRGPLRDAGGAGTRPAGPPPRRRATRSTWTDWTAPPSPSSPRRRIEAVTLTAPAAGEQP